MSLISVEGRTLCCIQGKDGRFTPGTGKGADFEAKRLKSQGGRGSAVRSGRVSVCYGRGVAGVSGVAGSDTWEGKNVAKPHTCPQGDRAAL